MPNIIEIHVNEKFRGALEGKYDDGKIIYDIPAEMTDECGFVSIKIADEE